MTARESFTCGQCNHFTKDKIGDGTGIGTCKKWDEFMRKQPDYRMIAKARRRFDGKPFWAFAGRFCDEFVGR